MIVKAPNWVGTQINAIAGTRGLRGFGQDDGTTSLQDMANALQSSTAALGVPNQPTSGTPASSDVIPTGTYSINPATGQLQQNILPGLSNSTLFLVAAVGVALVMFGGAMGGRR